MSRRIHIIGVSSRGDKPRLAAQLELHGDISDELIKLGYKQDDSWLSELEGIEPDNGQSYMPDRVSLASSVSDNLLIYSVTELSDATRSPR